MRIEDPVHWTASPDERGYWSGFRHKDVKTVFNEPILFSSEREGAAPALDNEMSAIASDAWGLGQNIALMRVATADTRLGGHRIREGDRMILWLPSANRDEAVFERPYEFDITRHPNLHLGFGAGPHFCLGGPLAKMEIRLALEEL